MISVLSHSFIIGSIESGLVITAVCFLYLFGKPVI